MTPTLHFPQPLLDALTSHLGRMTKRLATPLTRFLSFCLICVAAILQFACGGGGSGSSTTTQSPPSTSGQLAFSHVVLVMEENHSYSDVINNSEMPYLNSLASKYGLATQYFADAHPSIPNYLMLTTGQMETFDDSFSGTISDDNSVRELVKAGKGWKCYAESIPSQGYLGGDSGLYVRRHNPFSYLSDVQASTSQAANIVPFTQFTADLTNHALPQYAFIAPNVNDDAHNGTLAQADAWLQTNIAPLISDADFQNSGLLIITFDESEDADVAHGGGHVATIIVSSKAKSGYQSTALYQHESLLRLILSASGVTTLPGASASAPDMSEFFTDQ